MSVNLEGMQYTDWPVSRLIRRELANPKLLAVAETATGSPQSKSAGHATTGKSVIVRQYGKPISIRLRFR